MKRKILLDIFASPGTVLPIAGGITALLASWAVGGQSALNFAGVVGILGGFGIFASRLILGLEKITRDAYDHVMDNRKDPKKLLWNICRIVLKRTKILALKSACEISAVSTRG